MSIEVATNSRKKFVIFLLFFVPLFLMGTVLFFQDSFFPFYGVENYTIIHFILELVCIVISFLIAFQAYRGVGIYAGATFLSVGLLDLFHALTFVGMPRFFAESTMHISVWFWVVARMTQGIGLCALLLAHENEKLAKKLVPERRFLIYLFSFVYSLSIIVLIYTYSSKLPILFVNGVGPTIIHQGIEYGLIVVYAVTFGLLIRRTKLSDEFSFSLGLSVYFFILSGVMFTQYTEAPDMLNFVGHLLKLCGFFFLSYAVYVIGVKRMIQMQMQLQNELTHHALFDDVTNLPNTRHFNEKLSHLIQQLKPFGIIMFEIHQLQKMNNSLGHTLTNDILKLITKRLQQSLPSHYFLARMTDDYMAVLVPSAKSEQSLLSVCQQIIAVFDQPFKTSNLELMMNLSLGITIFPMDGDSPELLLDNAKAALDEARTKGIPHLFYMPEMRSKRYNKLLLENDLQKALENDELFLVYQPKIDMSTGKIYGFEALLRWNHRERGLISPNEFVPIAEETGLIVPIGEWVIETACKQLKEWHKLDPNLKMAVNFSFRQFYQPDITEKIKRMLNEIELPSHFLELELTESLAIEIDMSIEKIKNLKELGVRISIDDFGTGYSSLSYLKELPIDKLKIDRSFIRGLSTNKQDDMLVSTIISIAKNMKLEVIAEGVENVKQLMILQEKKCHHVQGYLFSKPEKPEYITKNFGKLQEETEQYFVK